MKLFSTILSSLVILGAYASNLEAQSSREEVVAGKTQIQHSGSEGQYRNIQLEAKLYEVYEKFVQKRITWTEWECDYVPGDGKGDWKGFYNVPKDRKPAALAAAIKGIGESRGRDIVYASGNYFSPKPRTWQAFKSEISRIERDLNMQGLYHDVIVQFGDENYHNLGYAPSGISGGFNIAGAGDGSSGDWKDYYNVPKDRKPAALAAAIRGIGDSTAQKIVNANIRAFEPKPRSWEAFKNEIKRIEREAGVDGLYDNVVARYGSDNKKNLGYSDSGSGNPNPPVYNPPREPDYVCRLVTKSGTQWVKETDRRYIRSYTRNVDVQISGSMLLSGETEVITLVYDGREVVFQETRTYNSYSVSEDQRDLFELVASKRRQVRPDAQDLQFSLSKDAGKLYLNVKDKRAEELESMESEYKMNVSLVLKRKAGRCSKDAELVKTTVTLDSGSSQIDLSALSSEALEAGETYYISSISFERLNSRFFEGSSAEAKSTDFDF